MHAALDSNPPSVSPDRLNTSTYITQLDWETMDSHRSLVLAVANMEPASSRDEMRKRRLFGRRSSGPTIAVNSLEQISQTIDGSACLLSIVSGPLPYAPKQTQQFQQPRNEVCETYRWI